MSKIDLSVDEILASTNKIHTIGPKPGSKGFAAGEKPLVIAPLNARINFGKFLARPSMRQTQKFASEAISLPETWSWRPDQINPKVDNGARLEAKKSITPILNQALCGSCWAFALASAMSDVFVVAGKFLTLPPGAGSVPDSAISPTSILSCYREGHAGCGGGNPAGAAFEIQEKGVFGSSCMDYSWILNNDDFNGNATGHFEASDMEKAMENALPPCGCAENAGERKKFTIKDVNTLPASTDDGTSEKALLNTWDTVRKWIWDTGSIVGGFVVYNNFMVKNFNDTDGVYFEDYPYDGKSKDISGFHAVKILGWGVQKNCLRPDGSRKDTQYWMVANSWGPKWGDNGYFKIARYPDNQTAQFDAVVNVGGSDIGGFIVFRAGNIFEAEIGAVDPTYLKSLDQDRLKSGFYKTDLSVSNKPAAGGGSFSGGGSNGDSSSSEEIAVYKKPWFIIIMVLLIIALVITGIVLKKRRAYGGYLPGTPVYNQPLITRPVSTGYSFGINKKYYGMR
jgi:hypothetical protein